MSPFHIAYFSLFALSILTVEIAFHQCTNLVSRGEDRRWYHEIILSGFVNEKPTNLERLLSYVLATLAPMVFPLAFAIGTISALILRSMRVRNWLAATA